MGILPFVKSFAVFNSDFFSSSVKVAASPVVPQMTSPSVFDSV
jgi:hypothetical protein